MTIIENLEMLIRKKAEIVEKNVDLRDCYYWGKDNEEETQEEYKEKMDNWDNTIKRNNQDIRALTHVLELLKEENNLEISKTESNVKVFDESLPFQVYKDCQMEKSGERLLPAKELVGAFASKEYAEDFVNYQATIDRETKYSVKRVEKSMQKEQKGVKPPQYQSPKL